jgi:hypothetical protein
MDTTPEQRHAFPEFANTRHAARAADKAVALGQIYFRVFFEHVDVATVFMMEVAALLAVDNESEETTLLIDNTGWDDMTMSGSGCSTRYLMGRPSSMESGPPALWRIRRACPTWEGKDRTLPAGGDGASEEGQQQRWWLCELRIRGRRVQVAVLPGEIHMVSRRPTGLLQKLRTCTALEKAWMKDLKLEPMEVMWL